MTAHRAALDHVLLWDDQFTNLLSRNPRTPDGLEFDAESIDMRQDWDYSDYDPGGENGRLRLGLPWQSPAGEKGTVQVDVAFGEPLPDTPVCTAVPRADGLPPLGLWTASAQLSLAWKLHWLAADQQTRGVSAMKDVYDAVLLAELDGMRLRPRLRRLALGAESCLRQSAPAPSYRRPSPPSVSGSLAPALPFTRLLEPAEIRHWRVFGSVPGVDDPKSWLSRPASATARLL